MKQGGNNKDRSSLHAITKQISKNEVRTRIVALANKKFTPYRVEKITIGSVKDKTRDIIKKATGIDAINYTHEVDNYALHHSMTGHEHDELPISAEDFANIPDILKNPDKVEYSGKTNLKLDAIKYSKQYNEIMYYYIEEIRTGRKTLNMTTMYKTKTPSDASTAD